MPATLRLAWQQLSGQRLRLLMALAGVAFAVVLMLMQMGFQNALDTSTVRFHERLRAEVVLIHPQSRYLVMMRSFPRRRLDQALGVPGVSSVSAVYTGFPFWDSGDNAAARSIFVMGFDPSKPGVDIPGVLAQLDLLHRPDTVLFDRASRPEYGPVAERLAAGELVECELNDQRFRVVGVFELGTSFGVDGSMVTSDRGFLRIFPGRSPGSIELGLIRAEPGVDPVELRQRLERFLPTDVQALTRAEFVQRENDYWNTVTPVGYIFAFGVLLGFGVGAVIVSQILFADVTDHLQEYATLKAIGYGNGFLYGVVLAEATILGFLGYLPGLALSIVLYRVTELATGLPMVLSPSIGVLVLVLTVAMCALSGSAALRKVQAADPAEIF